MDPKLRANIVRTRPLPIGGMYYNGKWVNGNNEELALETKTRLGLVDCKQVGVGPAAGWSCP